MATILLSLAVLSADYLASESTLAAGIAGYKQRAEAVRARAIMALAAVVTSQSASVAGARRGRVIPAVVGTVLSGKETDGVWAFGTSEEKATAITGLERGLDGLRETLTDMKSKKIYPQLPLVVRSPGSCGLFWGKARVVAVHEGEATVIGLGLRGRIIDDGNGVPVFDESEAGNWVDLVLRGISLPPGSDGKLIGLNDVFQFAGVEDNRPVLVRVDIPVGTMKCLFEDSGRLHFLWNQ